MYMYIVVGSNVPQIFLLKKMVLFVTILKTCGRYKKSNFGQKTSEINRSRGVHSPSVSELPKPISSCKVTASRSLEKIGSVEKKKQLSSTGVSA